LIKASLLFEKVVFISEYAPRKLQTGAYASSRFGMRFDFIFVTTGFHFSVKAFLSANVIY